MTDSVVFEHISIISVSNISIQNCLFRELK